MVCTRVQSGLDDSNRTPSSSLHAMLRTVLIISLFACTYASICVVVQLLDASNGVSRSMPAAGLNITASNTTNLSAAFRGQHVAFVGDSLTRLAFRALIGALDPTVEASLSTGRHQDLHVAAVGQGTCACFLWKPFIQELVHNVSLVEPCNCPTTQKRTVLVMSSVLWDVLHGNSRQELYKMEVQALRDKLQQQRAGQPSFWISGLFVEKERMNSSVKAAHLTAEAVDTHERIVSDVLFAPSDLAAVPLVVPVMANQSLTTDGVHAPRQAWDQFIEEIGCQLASYGSGIHVQPKKQLFVGRDRLAGLIYAAALALMVLTRDGFLVVRLTQLTGVA